jgi:hypothetical protein
MFSHRLPTTRRFGAFLSPGDRALLGLAVLGLGLRIWRACSADWYWDEGYLAELALDLGRLQRPHSGALWFNGVLPITSSWLAPLSAAPFTWFFPKNALLAVRLWAAVLGAVSVVLLGLAGQRLGGWKLGLPAAALFSVGPFPVAFGGLGLYHHLSCALALASLWTALPPLPDEQAPPDWVPWLLAGLSAASCYWLWWLPLALCLRPAAARLWDWIPRLALGFGPLALVLFLSLGLGNNDAQAMWKGMLSYNYTARYLADLSKFPSFYPVPWKAAFGPFCDEMGKFLASFPAAWLGLSGLVLLGRRRAWIWAGPVLGLADLIRQRGCPVGCPYDFIPLLPWICLGLALGAGRLASALPRLRWPGWVLAAALLVPCHLAWMERLFMAPPMARNLQAFLRTQHCEQDTVVAEPNVEWRLRQVCRPVEFSQTAAARGWSAGLLPAHLSKSAFAYDPSLEKARFLVTSPEDFDVEFGAPHVALEALVAEYEGWPKVFENPRFRVYANPRFGGGRDPATRILGDPILYRQTAADAQALGHADWAAFALARAASARLPQAN